MPKYQYRCTQCAHELEVQQKFTDDPLTVCPECDGGLRKVYNAVGVVFKGSGFYKTDSRSSKSASDSASSSSSSSAKESSSGSSSKDSSSGTKTSSGSSSNAAKAD